MRRRVSKKKVDNKLVRTKRNVKVRTKKIRTKKVRTKKVRTNRRVKNRTKRRSKARNTRDKKKYGQDGGAPRRNKTGNVRHEEGARKYNRNRVMEQRIYRDKSEQAEQFKLSPETRKSLQEGKQGEGPPQEQSIGTGSSSSGFLCCSQRPERE